MKPITLSINPTYLCNFSCDFCYLTPEQLRDTKTLSLDRLSRMLDEVTHYTTIEHVDLYGGEITTLSDDYQVELVKTIRRVYQGTINVVTNFYRESVLFKYPYPKLALSVSYDFSARERHEKVYQNLLNTSHPVHILTLATPCVMRLNVDSMIQQLNAIPTVESVEIKPYSANQANQLATTHEDYEGFIMRWIRSPVHKRFTFTNEVELKRAAIYQRNSFSDDHVYITPDGTYAVLEFDLNNNEYFKPMYSFDEYIKWSIQEKQRTYKNSYCNSCEYLGTCLTEHIRYVDSVDKSCNGYYKLIKWYKNERMENTTSYIPRDQRP